MVRDKWPAVAQKLNSINLSLSRNVFYVQITERSF